MSTNLVNSIDVNIDSVSTSVQATTDVVNTNCHQVDVENPKSLVEGYKKEYSIVGDALYASVSAEETPQWLAALIDNVVASAVANGMTDYDLLVQDVRNAIDSIDVAKNTFVEQINFDASVDAIIASRLQTLNATLDNKFATIVDLDTAVVNADLALTQRASELEASFDDSLNSSITAVQTAFADADSALASDINALTTVFEDQENNLTATADAVSGLQTYVGVTGDNVPDGTGILESIAILQKQTDGLVETFVDTHELLNYVNDDDVTPESMRFDQYPYALWVPMEGPVDPVDTTRVAYHDSTPKVYPVPEHTVYKNTTANTYWEYHPTTAGGWEQITEDEYNTRLTTVRQAHVGDSYIRYETVLGSRKYVEAYKFIKAAPDTTPPYLTDTEGYAWIVVSDSAAESAYVAALNAFDLADGKRRVFMDTPFIPYDKGDLWVDASVDPQIVKVSTVNNTLGFNSSDWVQADQQAEDFITNTYEPDSAQIHRQLDGKIEYTFYDSYTDIPGAISESGALWIISLSWDTQELKDNANGNIVYFKDTQNAYWYSASTNTWLAVEDTSVFSALQAAEGKVSQFYAWGGSSTPADYTFVNNAGDDETVLADNFKYWLKPSDNTLYYKPNTTWIAVPTSINNSGTWLASGDIATVYDPTSRDVTSFNYNGTSWQQVGPTGLVSKSKFFVDLENEVVGDSGHVATALSNLESSSKAYTDAEGARVENKFAYDSNVILNGQYYQAGFGLDATAVTGGTGTVSDPYNSEFWINAEKFRFTNSNKTGSAAPFSIDASGLVPEVTFNGKVTFGSSQTGTVDEAIYAAISTIPLGDKNVNITDNLIPTISFVVDEDNAGYQINGNVTKVTTAGVDTFAEAQANLDTNGELYSPYSDELQIPYYYRYAIYGSTDFSQFGIYEVDTANNVTTQNMTYALEPGVTLDAHTWYIVEGIVNPYGGNASDYDGVIRTPDNTKIGTVRNIALTSSPALFVLGWVAGGIPIKLSRMKLAPITADTVAVNNTLNYVDDQIDGIDVSGDILASQNALAQNLGYADYAGLQAAATLGNTVINGGYLNTDLIEVDAISATQISAVDLSAVSAEVGELNMTAYPSYIRHSKGQVLDTGNAGFWLGVDSAGKAGFAIGDSDQFLRYHPDIGLQIAGSEIVAVNIGDVAFVNNNPGSYTFTNNTLKYTQFSFRMVGGGGGGGPSGGSGGSSSISVPGGSSYTASGGSGGNSLNNYSRAGRDAGITIVSYRDGDGGQGGYIASFDFALSYEGGYAGQVVTGNLTIPLGGTVNIVVGNYGSATGSGGSTPGYAGAVELVIEGV